MGGRTLAAPRSTLRTCTHSSGRNPRRSTKRPGCRAPGRRRLHLSGPPGTSPARTPGHRQRPTAGQPHPPAPQERGLRPGRLPHRLRPPAGHLPSGPDQRGLARPLPDLLAHAAPLIVARFTTSQCRPCPVRTRCTTIADSARTVDFPPRELRDLQLRARAEQQTPAWKIRYAVEGTINEFAHGHGMRPCRYRGQPKTYLQHVLMAIAVNIERLSGLPPTEEPPHHLHGQGEFAHGRPMRGLPGLRATGTRFGRPRPARPRGGGVPRARCPTAAAAVRPCPRRHRRCA